LRTVEEIRAVCSSVSKPVNVLGFAGMNVRSIFAAGAQRVSVGGSLTWTAVEGFAQAAERIRDGGDLSALASPKRIWGWLSA
jgi:2-methylisocitrate lyase-like PEP mutase family enzyme